MWTDNFQMIKLNLEKAEEPDFILQTFVGLSKEQKSSRKMSTSALLTMSKPLTVWIQTNCWKFTKLGFNSMWTENFQMFKLDLEKAEEPEIKLITEKSKEIQKNSYFCFIDYTKAFDCVDHNKLVNS